jgi:hypothetical protein
VLVLFEALKRFPSYRNSRGTSAGRRTKALFVAGLTLVLAAILAGCGDGHERIVTVSGPGLVGIDDSAASTAPLLSVTYTVSTSPFPITANILSDPASDGDIAFDPFLNTFTVTTGPLEVFFGVDSLDADLPEYRAFLTFPLDGFTGQPVVPSDAAIVSAFIEVLVDEVSFASAIPTFLDLVPYPFRGLSAADFDAPLLTPTSFRSLNFFFSDRGRFVRIDVTSLMREAQLPPALVDFQVRFSLQTASALSAARTPQAEAGRSVLPPPRSYDKISLSRGASSEKPTREALASRHR